MKIVIKSTDPGAWGRSHSHEHKSHYFTLPNLNEIIQAMKGKNECCNIYFLGNYYSGH